MRDFRKEEIDSVNRGVDCDAGEFSWSLFRDSVFRRCPLEYFIRFHYSSGGWDPYADDSVKMAWREKHSLSPMLRLDRILNEALAVTLNALRYAPGEIRMQVFCSRFELTVNRLLLHESGNAELRAQIMSAAGALLETDTFRVLLALQSSGYLHERKPVSFPFDDFMVWYEPGLIWLEENTVCSLHISFNGRENRDQRFADVAALAAMKDHPGLRSLAFFFRHTEDGWNESMYEGSARSAASYIRESAGLMCKKTVMDRVSAVDFPPCCDPAVCERCSVAGVCMCLRDRFKLG